MQEGKPLASEHEHTFSQDFTGRERTIHPYLLKWGGKTSGQAM